jgi:hypothetical protein
MPAHTASGSLIARRGVQLTEPFFRLARPATCAAKLKTLPNNSLRFLLGLPIDDSVLGRAMQYKGRSTIILCIALCRSFNVHIFHICIYACVNVSRCRSGCK